MAPAMKNTAACSPSIGRHAAKKPVVSNPKTNYIISNLKYKDILVIIHSVQYKLSCI
jgi:hypothetical protein